VVSYYIYYLLFSCAVLVNGLLAVVSAHCFILRSPGGERIVDVVPGGTELELQLRWGVGQATHTCSNPHIKCTGVY